MAFSNEMLRKALVIVLERKKANEKKYEQQKSALYNENPELCDIENKLQQKSAKLALSLISGNSGSEELKSEIETLNKSREAFFKAAKFKDEPVYTCKKCSDTGYQNGALCSCVKEIATNLCYSQFSNEMPIKESTFQNFDISLYPEAKNDRGVCPKKQMTAVLKTIKTFVDNFPSGENLLLTGDCGLGKTHLSLAIANEIIAKDYNVIYGSAQNLINEVSRETFDRSGSTEKIDSLTSCDLLILDDLGTEFATQLSASVVYNIINTRLLRGLSTVISTNLTLPEISQTYTDRIASRIVGSYKICTFFGDDIRQKKSVNR